MTAQDKQQTIYDNLVKQGYQHKYGKPGIYAIYIEDKYVYIGKSNDMLRRVAQHIFYIENNWSDGKAHKYQILREAKSRGYNIRFDVLATPKEEDLGWVEGWFIRSHMPALNYQIPKEDNWHSFTINKTAQTITLDEIMGTSVEGFTF